MPELKNLKREHYDKLVGAQRDFRSQIAFLDKLFKKHKVKTILDCGCGTGTHAIMLAKKGYKITAFDYSRQQVELAKKKAKQNKVKIDFKTADIKDFDLGRFDAAISLFSVIMFACKDIKDLKKSLRCIRNSLKPDGIALIETCTPELGKTTISIQKHLSEKLKIARVRIYEKTGKKNLVNVTYSYTIKKKGNKPSTVIAEATNRFFTKSEFESALKNTWFKPIQFYGSFDGNLKKYENYTKKSFFITPLIKNTKKSF